MGLLSLAVEGTLQKGGHCLNMVMFVFCIWQIMSIGICRYICRLFILPTQCVGTFRIQRSPLHSQTTIRVKRKAIQIFTPSTKFSCMNLRHSCSPLLGVSVQYQGTEWEEKWLNWRLSEQWQWKFKSSEVLYLSINKQSPIFPDCEEVLHHLHSIMAQ